MKQTTWSEEYFLKQLNNVFINKIWVAQYPIKNNRGTYYYVDFYNPDLNIVIEHDEAYHRIKKIKKADKLRQEEITSILNCVFYRYDATSPYPRWVFINRIMNLHEVIKS